MAEHPGPIYPRSCRAGTPAGQTAIRLPAGVYRGNEAVRLSDTTSEARRPVAARISEDISLEAWGADSLQGGEVRFVPNSPLEGDGFEPSVPHKKQPFLAAPIRSPQFAFRNKKRLFRARDRWFESISLQQTVRLSPASAFERREPRLPARVCAAGLAAGSAETRMVFRCRANRRQYLCRAIFQYRGAADVVGENTTPVPMKSGLRA